MEAIRFVGSRLTDGQRDEMQRVLISPGLYHGGLIGEVDITDCYFRSGEENNNLYSVWHIPGQYGFVLANPVLYDKPIPCRGQLRLFIPI